jgi:O-antigen/teichoic acid export membrane protein
MVLSDRLLAVWLGEKFTKATAATVIFLAWWLFAPNASVPNSMMVVDGQLRRLAAYSWSIAGVNLALSLALTPLFGLVGVAIGTTAAYLSVLPFFLRYALRRRRIPVGEFARAVWVPAYGAGAALALALLGVRLATTLESAFSVLAVAALGTLAGYALLLGVFFDDQERAMFRSFLRRA